MKEIVADLDGRRRVLFEEAKVHLKEFVALIKQRREERKAKEEAAKAEAAPAEEADVETQIDEALEEREAVADEEHAASGETLAAKKPEPLLTAEDGRRRLGKTSGVLASPERAGRATKCLTNEFQGVRAECLSPAATQEMEGLDEPDDNRTNSNTFAKRVRGLRTDRSQTGSVTAFSRSEVTVAVAKRSQPPQVGLERDLQNGGGGRDHRGQPGRLARNPESSEDPNQTHYDQASGSVGIIRVGSEGEDDFSAGCLGRNATWRDSRSTLGKVDPLMIEVAQRVYRGLPDEPKTEKGETAGRFAPRSCARSQFRGGILV